MVSPYLNRPLRSLSEALADRLVTAQATGKAMDQDLFAWLVRYIWERPEETNRFGGGKLCGS